MVTRRATCALLLLTVCASISSCSNREEVEAALNLKDSGAKSAIEANASGFLKTPPRITLLANRGVVAKVAVSNPTKHKVCFGDFHLSIIYRADTGKIGHDSVYGDIRTVPKGEAPHLNLPGESNSIGAGETRIYDMALGKIPYIRSDVDDSSIDMVRELDQPFGHVRNIDVRFQVTGFFTGCERGDVEGLEIDSPETRNIRIDYQLK